MSVKLLYSRMNYGVLAHHLTYLSQNDAIAAALNGSDITTFLPNGVMRVHGSYITIPDAVLTDESGALDDTILRIVAEQIGISPDSVSASTPAEYELAERVLEVKLLKKPRWSLRQRDTERKVDRTSQPVPV